MSFCKTQTLFEFGAEEKAEETVMTAPEIPDTFLVSTEPSDNTTLNVALFVASRSVLAVSSTVIAVVVADAIFHPLLSPLLTGSLTSMICPGLTNVPASSVTSKEQVSPEFCSLYKNHFPILEA